MDTTYVLFNGLLTGDAGTEYNTHKVGSIEITPNGENFFSAYGATFGTDTQYTTIGHDPDRDGLSATVNLDNGSSFSGQMSFSNNPYFECVLEGADVGFIRFTMTRVHISGTSGTYWAVSDKIVALLERAAAGEIDATVRIWPGLDTLSNTIALPGDTAPTVPCFTVGTRIRTSEELERPIEHLQVGDAVWTYNGSLKPIRWIGRRLISNAEFKSNPKLRPVRIEAGALGNGLPRQDLLVSRQHRLLVSSKIAMEIFGTTEALISAIKLTKLPGIYVDEGVSEIEYVHLLFDQHEIIFSEYAPTESFYTGAEAMKAISQSQREEILSIFPELAASDYLPQSARLIPTDELQKQFVMRHAQQAEPLLLS